MEPEERQFARNARRLIGQGKKLTFALPEKAKDRENMCGFF